jgi:hypothetical protein
MNNGTDLTADLDLNAVPERVDLHHPEQRQAVERDLASIPGVRSVRLVPGYDRDVDELHLVTSPDRAPKQTVRDAQTLLMARFGIATDHRVISIVQLDEPALGLPQSRRVVIERVTVAHEGLTVTAEVTVADQEEERLGRADGPSSVVGQRRAIARATLASVEPLLDQGAVVDLEAADITQVMGQPVAISLVHVRTGRGEYTLCGSAIVRDGEANAIARSVLDALNRTLDEAAQV